MSLKNYALTSVARAKAFGGLTLNATEDSVMESIVNATTEFVEQYTGTRFKKTAYTNELYSTERSETLKIKHYPILSTETFTLSRRTTPENEDEWQTVDSQYYHIDYDSGILMGAGGLRFARTNDGYRVSYTAGYDFDNTTTFLSDTKAGDVELVVWMLCKSVWDIRRGGSNIERESIGDYSVTYRKFLFENEDAKSILDKYADVSGEGVITPFQDYGVLI